MVIQMANHGSDVNLTNKITMLIESISSPSSSINYNDNSPTCPENPNALTALCYEVDRLSRLSHVNGDIQPGYHFASPLKLPERLDPKPESMLRLYMMTGSLVNNTVSRIQILAWEMQLQMSVLDYKHQNNIEMLVWSLGTQLQGLGEVLVELGQITSSLEIKSTNAAPGIIVPSGPPVYLGDQSARPPNPHQRVLMSESLETLYMTICPVLDNVVSGMRRLAWQIKFQQCVADATYRRLSRNLAKKLGTQLHEVGESVLEIGLITSALQIYPTDTSG